MIFITWYLILISGTDYRTGFVSCHMIHVMYSWTNWCISGQHDVINDKSSMKFIWSVVFFKYVFKLTGHFHKGSVLFKKYYRAFSLFSIWLSTLGRPKATSLEFDWKQLRFLTFFGIPEAISRRNPSEAESERTFQKIGIPKAKSHWLP